jgi:ribose 5-phosphate isomerase B
MRIAMTADHNGTVMKTQLAAWLEAHGHDVDDRSPVIGDDPVDYPPLCSDVCRRIVDCHADWAVVVGGSGSGEQIACNKIRGIRAALCHNVFTAQIARGHNDANVLVLGAKVVTPELAAAIVAAWCETAFKGGPHQHRLDQIAVLERGDWL